MLEIKQTGRFDKQSKRMQKRGKQTAKLWNIVEILATGNTLEPKHHMHKLKGDWAGYWECHIEPDWLLVFEYVEPDMLVLVATGTHSDLFK